VWLNLATWFLNAKTAPALAIGATTGNLAMNAYSYNSAIEINKTTQTMESTNLVAYPVAIGMGFLTLVGIAYQLGKFSLV
jgi:hypothetical protein